MSSRSVLRKGKLISRQYLYKAPFILQKYIWILKHRNELGKYEQFINSESASWNKYNSIFIHIPKCAGISVATALFGRQQVPAHLKLVNYKVLLPQEKFNNSFKFTFVRNPWDRVVSAYEYFLRGGRVAHDKQWADDILHHYSNFEEFVVEWVREENIWEKEHFALQSSFININGKPLVDFIGRYEEIDSDYEKLRGILKFGLPLPVINKTVNRKPYQSYYSDKTAAIVERVYADDILLLNYSFE